MTAATTPAANPKAAAKPAKKERVQVSFVDRTKGQLSRLALANKLSADDLGNLKTHIDRISALLATA